MDDSTSGGVPLTLNDYIDFLRRARWKDYKKNARQKIVGNYIYLFAPELFFLILAHPVYKMWIIQEPNKLALWNKLHFEEKKTESIEHV